MGSGTHGWRHIGTGAEVSVEENPIPTSRVDP